MKIDTIRRQRRAIQIRQALGRIRRHLLDVDKELSQLLEYANELGIGIVGYVGVHKKNSPGSRISEPAPETGTDLK